MLVATLLIGAWLRLDGLGRDVRLHGDEALFASYGRLLVLKGDWNLYEVPIDKPPLTFAMVGGSLALLGESEFAVRVPNAFASIINLALIFRLGAYVTRSFLGGWLSALLLATSPLSIAYAPTAFQDPPMLTAILAATLLLLHHKWGFAGIAFGVAIWMKPTASYLLPLLLVLAIVQRERIDWRHVYNFTLMIALLIFLLILWDQSRLAQSFFELGNYNNNPGRLIRPEEIQPRLDAWLRHLGAVVGAELVAVIFVATSSVWLLASARKRIEIGLYSWWIVAYAILYMGWHWLVAFPIYDRYVLPILPFLILVGAQALNWMWARWRVWIIALIVIVLLNSGDSYRAFERIDPNARNDLNIVAETLNEQYAGQLVYDFALGWHLRWYLGGDSTVQVVFWPTPEGLAAHMQNDDGLRYLIAPSATEAEPWLYLLERNGVIARAVYHGETMLYELTPPSVDRVSGSADGNGVLAASSLTAKRFN